MLLLTGESIQKLNGDKSIMLSRSSAWLQGAATVDFGNTAGRQTIPYCNERNSWAALISRHATNTPPCLPKALFLHAESQTKMHPQSQFSQQFFLRNLPVQRSSSRTLKPLHLIPRSRRAVRVEAKIEDEGKCKESIEGASGASIHQNEEPRDTCSRRLKIALYFVVWWTLNVLFNIYNKKVLSVFPFPWLASWLCLAGGAIMMFSVWATGLVEPPKTDSSFWKALFPVALAHTIGHVAATVSMSRVAMSFTHIIKSAEPAFSVIIESLFLGQQFPWPVYLSLVPIVAGCCLSALTEIEFDLTGFVGAMISNVAFVFRNLFSKKAMKGESIGGINFYACLCLESLVLLTPLAVAAEGLQVWSSGWEKAVQQIGPQFVWWVLAQSMLYHLYNQVSYMSLSEISPLAFSIGNTMKRVSLVVAAIMVFKTPMHAMNVVGAAIAILGTFVYYQVSSSNTPK